MAPWISRSHPGQNSRADSRFWRKLIFWALLWSLSWTLAIFAPLPGWARVALAFLNILTHPFIALNVAHDANHNAITKHPLGSFLLKRSFDLIGISSFCWRLNHNRLHHPHTSVPGVDTTADGKKILRLNETEPRYFFHRLQHLYAPLAYGLVTLNYVFLRDFRDFYRLARERRVRWLVPFLECLGFKLLYLSLMLVLPMRLLPYSPWAILLTFITAHFLLGQIIILIQVPHFNLLSRPISASDVPKERDDELAFVLRHTTDMAPQSRLWSWLLGGTNTHIIHHLYPQVCHSYYPEMTKELQDFCQENNLGYNHYESITESYGSHYRYLRRLGQGT